ncbi:MAG: regulatory protein RecX [Cyclobacteriaceae bacterium]|nr:regulatory protein RecX [Cyclobacteriaceae bacterium]
MRDDKIKEAKAKAGHFCAYQERSQQEVRDKLYLLGLYSDEVELVLSELITENYVNEERFARSFASGKFRIKQWGRRKIAYALKQRHISTYCISRAMQEIPQDEYLQTIELLIAKKARSLTGDQLSIKRKVANYLISKGFEGELVWDMLN